MGPREVLFNYLSFLRKKKYYYLLINSKGEPIWKKDSKKKTLKLLFKRMDA